MTCGVQRKVAESEKEIDTVPDIVQQSGVESCFVSLLVDDGREQQPIRGHLETDRVLVVFLREQPASIARSEAETAVPVYGHERAQFEKRRSIEVRFSRAFVVVFVSGILRRFVGDY